MQASSTQMMTNIINARVQFITAILCKVRHRELSGSYDQILLDIDRTWLSLGHCVVASSIPALHCR